MLEFLVKTFLKIRVNKQNMKKLQFWRQCQHSLSGLSSQYSRVYTVSSTYGTFEESSCAQFKS